MKMDLGNVNNLDESLSGFNAMKVIKRAKVELGVFDKVRPLKDAKEELDNLTNSRAGFNTKIIDAIKANDKQSADKASKDLRLLNHMINLVQNEVDYKTKLEFIKANAISKAPEEVISKEVIEEAKDKAEEIESDAKQEKELSSIITDIKASNGNLVSKAKSEVSKIIDSPKEYFTPKKVAIYMVSFLAIFGFIKLIK